MKGLNVLPGSEVKYNLHYFRKINEPKTCIQIYEAIRVEMSHVSPHVWCRYGLLAIKYMN